MDAGLAAMVIGVTAPIVSLVVYSFFKERRDKAKMDFNKWKLKYQVKKGIHNKQLKKLEKQKKMQNKGYGDLIDQLDSNKIKGILHSLRDKDLDIEDEEEADIGDVIANIVEENPDLVDGFLKGIGGKKQEKNENNLY